MTLKHHMRDTSVGIPELDTPILGTAHDPLPVRGQADTKNKVLKECQYLHL